MSFKIQIDEFRGPIDLLLYLVRRHEIEISRIALSGITEQYIQHLEVLKEIQIDTVGDFIEVASLLLEIKARSALPRNELDPSDDEFDPRQDLVERLLMYKQFKDAASLLDERAGRWHARFSRLADDTPAKKEDISDQPIKEVELWDLVSAFGRVLRDNRPQPEENIVYDETPIQVYMQRIHQRLLQVGRVSFSQLFQPGMHKSAMVGIFLAVLELARHHNVRTEQTDLHGEILIIPDQGFGGELAITDVSEYEHHKPKDPDSAAE